MFDPKTIGMHMVRTARAHLFLQAAPQVLAREVGESRRRLTLREQLFRIQAQRNKPTWPAAGARVCSHTVKTLCRKPVEPELSPTHMPLGRPH